MSKISAVIVAHNEEEKIAECLQSLGFVDEIIVVLDKCSDHTKEIARKYTDNIIEGSWAMEGARRNVAVNAATSDWVLEIDADERISPELAQEIIEIKNSEPCAFTVPIANYIGERYVKFGWLRTLCVLERQTIHYRGLKKYHEDKEVHPECDLKAEIKYLTNPIIHLVDEDLSDLITRFNRYTSWRANDINRKKQKAPGIFKSIYGLKMRFFKAFIIKKGYKEGVLGFVIAILTAIYPMVSHIKAKEKQQS